MSHVPLSPNGKLIQIEYALQAVAAGATSLGIRASNGVVIATEKKVPTILVDESTVQKIAMVTPHTGVVYSGMGPDARVLVRKSRKGENSDVARSPTRVGRGSGGPGSVIWSVVVVVVVV